MTIQTGCDRIQRTSRCATVWSARRACHCSVFVAFLVLLSSFGTANASCWETAGARYGIHPWLLAAIAKVESRFDPNAVNATHAARTGSVDLGLMQINSSWLPVLARHGITRQALFDACTSIAIGAWILADLFARHGVTWEAVGAYNAACVRLEQAECTTRRAVYARKVEAALRELSGAQPVALASRAARHIAKVSLDDRRVADAFAVAPIGEGGQ